jgi:two-component system, OmpR family, alkaline phosphatase synthesis response regulator PhoP
LHYAIQYHNFLPSQQFNYSQRMNKNIIIFEDDQDILTICSIVLQDRGFAVKAEENTTDVVDKVLQSGAGIVMMDNSIPGVGGVTATQTLKQDNRTKNIPIIFFSANANVEALSTRAGADYYLQKPFNISELEKIAEQALGV